MYKKLPVGSVPSQEMLQSTYRKTVLPNGMRIVTEEVPYVRSVAVGLWIDAGSRDERRGNNGISHFVEHMVFKGTRHYSTRGIARSLESVGGYINAFTTKEHTCYYARALDEHLGRAVKVLTDLVRFPVFKERDIEKEKQVVLEELKNIEDDPDDLIHDYLDLILFQEHPLGFPVIGTAANIRSFTRADLLDYCARFYQPAHMVAAAAGNVRHDEFAGLVWKLLGGIDGGNGRRSRKAAPRSVRPEKNEYEKPINQAHVCLGTIGCSVRSKHRFSVMVLNTLLGDGMSSRLFQNIRERYGIAYNIYSFTNLLSDTGNFGVYVGTDAINVRNSIELIVSELAGLRRKEVGPAELKRTKSQLKGTIMLGLESIASRMMRLGSGELYYGGYVPPDEMIRKIDAVGADDILDVARRLFRPERFSTVVIKPSAAQ